MVESEWDVAGISDELVLDLTGPVDAFTGELVLGGVTEWDVAGISDELVLGALVGGLDVEDDELVLDGGTVGLLLVELGDDTVELVLEILGAEVELDVELVGLLLDVVGLVGDVGGVVVPVQLVGCT
jgi:hypothetical protein